MRNLHGSASPRGRSNDETCHSAAEEQVHSCERVGTSSEVKNKLNNTRYFVIKSLNHQNIQLSIKKGVWATQVMNEPILEEAFQNSGKVILIFSVNMSGFFQGYAQMMSSVGWRRDNIWSQGSGKNNPWGRSFKVKWLRLHDLPFQKTLHLKNPWNEFKPVKISRDCQELPGDIGSALCELLDEGDDMNANLFRDEISGDGFSARRPYIEPFHSVQDEDFNVPPMHMSPLLYSSLLYHHQAEASRFQLPHQRADVILSNISNGPESSKVKQSRHSHINGSSTNKISSRTDSHGLSADGSTLISNFTEDDILEMTYEEYLEAHTQASRRLHLTADLLLSYGYEDDLKALTAYVPKRCQCLLMSATSSADVEKLKKLILHNPYILTLPEVGDVKDDIIPRNVQQFYISCITRDKIVHILALLKLELVQKKVLIFVNSIDMSFRLKLFFEQFGIKSAVLNAELPQNSRLHILEEFNAGLFDYLIASDVSQSAEEQNDKESHAPRKKAKKHSKKKLDAEFGVVRGVDFKNVHTVINYDMPQTAAGYVHRIGRTGRAYNTGASVSLVSHEEMEIFEEIKSILGENGTEDSKFIAPFPLLSKNAVESLRYRAEDVARGITKIAVRESRAQDLRNEILNSEKLKAHFQDNPKDLDLLKHDKVLSKKEPAVHLRDVPEYLLDPTTKEASKIVKLARAAMGNSGSTHRKGFKGKFKRRSKDPLKTFSAEAPKRTHKSGMKRKGKNQDDGH